MDFSSSSAFTGDFGGCDYAIGNRFQMSYGAHRQELVRNRERLEEAERALRDLRIEADLAGVPPDWRDDRKVPLGKRLPESPYYN